MHSMFLTQPQQGESPPSDGQWSTSEQLNISIDCGAALTMRWRQIGDGAMCFQSHAAATASACCLFFSPLHVFIPFFMLNFPADGRGVGVRNDCSTQLCHYWVLENGGHGENSLYCPFCTSPPWSWFFFSLLHLAIFGNALHQVHLHNNAFIMHS